jgi:hypothetical protein
VTLQIPFVLLGRRDLIDPDKEWAPSEGEIGPVKKFHDQFKFLCPHTHATLGSSSNAQHAGWSLRPLPANPASKDGKDLREHLSANEKAYIMDNNIWTQAMRLQCSGMPLSSDTSAWWTFRDQAKKILETFEKIRDWPGKPKGAKAMHGGAVLLLGKTTG